MPAAIAGAITGEVAGVFYSVVYAVVTVALNYGLAKLAQSLSGRPKNQPFQVDPSDRNVTIRGTVEPRRLIYGQVKVAGIVVHSFIAGLTDNVLFLVVAFAGHQVEEFSEFYVAGVKILPWQIGGTGEVMHPAFLDNAGSPSSPYLFIFRHEGRSDQTVDTTLFSQDNVFHRHSWDESHIGRGVAYCVFAFGFHEKIWATGAPQDVYAVIKGRRLYSQRKDSTNGGSGAHRYNDARTWEWSDNFSDCVRDYLTGGSITYDVATPKPQLGLGETNARMDDPFFLAAANISDEQVDVPLPVLPGRVEFAVGSAVVTGIETDFKTRLQPGNYLLAPDDAFYQILSITNDAFLTLTSIYAGPEDTASQLLQWNTAATTNATQKRYTCNTQLSCGTTHGNNLDILLSAGGGHVTPIGGKYRLYAGAYLAPIVELTASDCHGDVAIATSQQREKLYNLVSGTFFDPDRLWTMQSFPSQTQLSYQTADGDLYTRTIELNATTDNYRAQRIANLHLLHSRNKTTVMFSKLRPKALMIAEWDTFTVTLSEFGWASQVFRCLEWTFLPTGYIQITAEIETSSAYADLDPDDYQLPRNNTPAAPTASAPAAPNALTMTSYAGMLYVVVGFADTLPAGTIVQVYEHTSSSPFSSAVLVASGAQTEFAIPKNDTTVRYYWATAKLNGQVSAHYPASTGMSGQALPALTATSLVATGIPGAITFTWSASGAQPPGTLWELWEYTSSTPFSSATKIWEGGATTYTKVGDTPTAKYYWVRARTNGTEGTQYPASMGVTGQALAPVAPNALTLTGFPTHIKVVVGFAATPPAGTIVELWEYTANTPFSSATKIDEGEQLVFYVPKRDTTTRYYWVRTRLSGQTSSTYPSGNGTAGAADLTQNGDVADNAATEVTTLTDAGELSDTLLEDSVPNDVKSMGYIFIAAKSRAYVAILTVTVDAYKSNASQILVYGSSGATSSSYASDVGQHTEVKSTSAYEQLTLQYHFNCPASADRYYFLIGQNFDGAAGDTHLYTKNTTWALEAIKL